VADANADRHRPDSAGRRHRVDTAIATKVPDDRRVPIGRPCTDEGRQHCPRAPRPARVPQAGDGTVTHPRLYQLIRQPGPISERTFEITFLDPGVEAYAFTFG
jgi:Thioredoxin like C-terminal domain